MEILQALLGKFAVTRSICALLSLACLEAVPATGGQLKVPEHFTLEKIAYLHRPRELAFTPNGDLLIGTDSGDVMIVGNAEGQQPRAPKLFVHAGDPPAAGVALTDDTLFIGTQFAVWRVPYHAGDAVASAKPTRIAQVRTGGGGGHGTTSLAIARDRLYVSVGSSCDACDPERDATRATVQEMKLDGSGMKARAIRIRNAVALTVNPATSEVWAIPNGQDALEHGHPFEIGDPITLHPSVSDYGWPHCFENRRKVEAGADCAKVIIPRLSLPAYNAPIGAVIYPLHAKGKYAFPAAYAGGLFIGLHGSWHTPLVPPRVAFVALSGDEPKTAVDWSDPSKQWQEFVGGFQNADYSRIGRPTGVAVGTEGSLFIADDFADVIYRVRFHQD